MGGPSTGRISMGAGDDSVFTLGGYSESEERVTGGYVEGLLTFPWVGERRFHRGSGGQSPASDSIANAISALAL